jgi:RNA polymerase sigma factor (sigma-70 family)
MAKTSTDETLMEAVRDGDVGQLAELFDRYHRPLFEFFFRMTASQPISEDLVQDVFFRILKYRNSYRDKTHFRAWMYHIARNARVDHYRKHRGEEVFPEEGMDVAVQTTPFQGRQLEEQEEADLIKEALLKLSPEKRELLLLSRYQELKYEEISELLGCNIGTVKVRMHRAVKALRQIYLKLSGEKTTCNVKKSEATLRIM